MVPYTSGKIWSAHLIFLFFLAVCLNISTVINIKILANSKQQTQSYKFTSHIAALLSVVLITEMLEICIQTSYDQNVQLILKSYLPVVYGTPLKSLIRVVASLKDELFSSIILSQFIWNLSRQKDGLWWLWPYKRRITNTTRQKLYQVHLAIGRNQTHNI